MTAAAARGAGVRVQHELTTAGKKEILVGGQMNVCVCVDVGTVMQYGGHVESSLVWATVMKMAYVVQ